MCDGPDGMPFTHNLDIKNCPHIVYYRCKQQCLRLPGATAGSLWGPQMVFVTPSFYRGVCKCVTFGPMYYWLCYFPTCTHTTYIWRTSRENRPYDLCRCHTKRSGHARPRLRRPPSFGMTMTKTLKSVFSWHPSHLNIAGPSHQCIWSCQVKKWESQYVHHNICTSTGHPEWYAFFIII